MALELFRREIIHRRDSEPYLERLILFRCSWVGIMLHKFVDGDDPCSHDHPWDFVSFLLYGGYLEWTPAKNPQYPGDEDCVWYGPGSVLYRPAEWIHRVDISAQKKVISLVIHGPKKRSWGFWTKLGGWIHHSKYSYAKHCA